MTARDWTAVREALLAVDAAAIEAAMRKGDRAAMKRAGGTAGRLMNAIRRVLILDALPEFDASVDAFVERTAISNDAHLERIAEPPSSEEVA